ncbi:MAG: hypothetical protein FJX76_04370 [Armatimonadetes bacterium]|nr:hypothetical protein [Armatimonadota bacterium]
MNAPGAIVWTSGGSDPGGVTFSAAPRVATVAAPDRLRQTLDRLDAMEKSLDGFDLKLARRKSTAAITAAGLACTTVGQLAHAFLPATAALGVSAAVSLGIAAATMAGVNEIMHGVRDKGMLGGAAVLTFFNGFASPGAANDWGTLGAVAVGAGMALLAGFAFGHAVETNHHGLAARIEEARELGARLDAYQAQHAELEKRMSTAPSA